MGNSNGGRGKGGIQVPRIHNRQNEINNLQNEINILNGQINNINAQISYAESKDSVIQSNINNDNSKISDLTGQIRNLTYERDMLIISLNLKEKELIMILNSNELSNTYINSQQQELNNLAIDISGSIIDNQTYTRNFFNNIKIQNASIQKSNSQQADQYQTRFQKEYYETEQTNYVKSINFYLFFSYYLLLLIFIIILIFIQKTMLLYKKVIWAILLGIFPFIIMYIEEFIMYLVRSLLEIIQTTLPS
jgi:hypothetical protein